MDHDPDGALIRVTDPLLRETSYVRDADNLVRQSVRSNDGLLPDGTAPATVSTTLDYDLRGNVIAKTEAAGTVLARTTRFEYEPLLNRTVKIIDPSNSDPAPACGAAGVTCFAYDEFGNMTTVTDALGGQQVFTHLANGLKFTARDANLNLTQFFYDLAGNLEQVIDGAGSDTRLTYDPAGNVESRTDGWGMPEARTTGYTYDEMGRVLSETDPEGGITETVYDAAGNIIEETDATGIAATSTYDERDRLASETHPATGTVQRTYDENGNLASMIDPTGEIAHFQYDAMNRADRTEDPALGVRLFAYDLADNPKQFTDANGNASRLERPTLGAAADKRCPGRHGQQDSPRRLDAVQSAAPRTLRHGGNAERSQARLCREGESAGRGFRLCRHQSLRPPRRYPRTRGRAGREVRGPQRG